MSKINKVFICCLLSVVYCACSETDTESYCPTWKGFTYTIGSYPNYTTGNPRNVFLSPGDSIHITAHQDKKGHLINGTSYHWILCYDTLDTRNNEDPNDDVVVHVQKEVYREQTNYDGYADGANDPVGHLLIPANTLKTTIKPDTIKFIAYYNYSGQGITIETGNIVENTSYSGRIVPQSGPMGGGAAGYFYFHVDD